MRETLRKFINTRVPSHHMRLIGYTAVIAVTGPLWQFRPWGLLGTALGIYLVEKAVNVRQTTELIELRTQVQDMLLSVQHGKPVRTAEFTEVPA